MRSILPDEDSSANSDLMGSRLDVEWTLNLAVELTAESSEIRYFVVIGTERDGKAWEIGLSRPRTQWGSDGPEPRKERTRQLFDELKTAISLV